MKDTREEVEKREGIVNEGGRKEFRGVREYTYREVSLASATGKALETTLTDVSGAVTDSLEIHLGLDLACFNIYLNKEVNESVNDFDSVGPPSVRSSVFDAFSHLI